jgi:nicotinate-nucleotide adenylyltransferase
LEELAKEQPDTDVFLIVGQDAANRIGTWHRYEEVLALSTLVIVNRVENNSQLPEVLSGARVHNVSMPLVDVSSTSIRAKVASGEDIASLTSESVAAVVSRNGLYGATA